LLGKDRFLSFWSHAMPLFSFLSLSVVRDVALARGARRAARFALPGFRAWVDPKIGQRSLRHGGPLRPATAVQDAASDWTAMTMTAKAAYDLPELNRETNFGGLGTTKHREVPRIDLSGFEARKQQIADQLWAASTEIGFFQLVNHGIPQAQIDEAFEMTARFFALPHDIKAKYPLGKGTNSGWEYKSQVRPSTGTADNKESYQVKVPRMGPLKLWPSGEELPASRPRCWPSSAPIGRL
jgi:hypothetical protein